MATKNTESTRFYSDRHEKSVCKALNARQQSNSGAGLFQKGDVVQEPASLLIECKTCLENKNSFTIKKDWFEKNRQEAFALRLQNASICFNFGPDTNNYYIINEALMKFLVEKLKEDLM